MPVVRYRLQRTGCDQIELLFYLVQEVKYDSDNRNKNDMGCKEQKDM